MADSSQANSALDPRALSDAALARLPVDLSSLPPDVLTRLQERARAPDRRLMIGRYVICGELGRGGMGVVYDAWDPGIERRVAIKTIEPDLVPEEDREEVIERFRRETKIVGRLHHPGIVTIFDYGEERETGGLGSKLYYYVMEYLEGQSLARVLRERRLLPDVEAVAIVADVLEALHVSHSAGVIHRDIKPSNIFLRNGTQAVLLDFGIAKTGSVALTRQGQILGTPSYLAPERLREKEIAVDGRADIFSLGVLLFTMLTGDAPFVGEDVYDVIDKIAKASHPKLARTTPSGQALSRVIDRMLAKRPEDRYQSANDAAGALRNVQLLLRATNPEIGDLLSSGVRVREEMPESATEIASPSSVSAPDEEDTGRQPISIAAARAAGDDESLPEIEGAELIEDRGDDIPSADTPIRMADLLGTRPELALQRETRELDRSGGVRGAPSLPVRATVVEPMIEPSQDAPVTTPGLPAYSEGHESDEYESHSEANDETTDDQTIADPDAAKKGSELSLKYARASRPVSNPAAQTLLKAGSGPSPIPQTKAISGPTPLAPMPKSPSGSSPVPGGKHPSIPPPPAKSPSGPAPIPSASKQPSGPTMVPPVRTSSRSRLDPRGEERQTEQYVRAASPDHSELKTENERGRPMATPSSPPAVSVSPAASRSTRPAQKSKRSRIEASLVDEDDVVVKPAPLDALKPDELPTQTGFRVPPPPAPVPSQQAVQQEEERATPEGRVPDPAERPTEDGEAEGTEGGAMLEEIEERTAGARAGSEVDLEEDSGPVPELDAPRSAAVARRTFGRSGGPGGQGGAAAKEQNQRVKPPTLPPVQVRVSGTLSADRMRLVRRRGFMLMIAMLAAIAVGLFLGRMKQRSTVIDASGDGDPPKQMVEPKVSRVNMQAGLTEPELVKPRPASELIQDAAVALTEKDLPKAEELFERAVRAAPEKSRLRGQAMLGRADALKQLGKKDQAIELYKTVLADLPRTTEADEAKVALTELGVAIDAAPLQPPSKSAASKSLGGSGTARSKDSGKDEEAPAQKEREIAKEISADMSPEQKCLALMAKYINDPGEAVKALNRLAHDDPRSPCVYWHLGNSYTKLRDDRAALAAYKKYLELRPDALNRPAVEERIKNLATKLEER